MLLIKRPLSALLFLLLLFTAANARNPGTETLENLHGQHGQADAERVGRQIDTLIGVGAICIERESFAEARENLEKALALASQTNDVRERSRVYQFLGRLEFVQKRYTAAKQYTQKALALAGPTHLTCIRMRSHRQLADICAAAGDYRNAYVNYIEYKALSDTLTRKANACKVAMLDSSYRVARERERFEQERAGDVLRIRNHRQSILSLVVILLLVLLLAITVYWHSRLRKKVLQFCIKSINRELEDNRKAMAVAQLKLMQNSERSAQTVRILEQIGKNLPPPCQGLENLGEQINAYKFQDNASNWEEFETLFSQVNASFWDKLNALYPDLTPNERKLCIFLKLNMNSKDIALITLQSEEALKKSRLRLRRKLGMDRSANLTAFIHSL